MKTLVQFFEESVEKFSNNVYLWEKPGEKYEGTTYGETRHQVYEFASGLINLGIKKGDRLCLISEGRNNWVVGELGILYTGAVNVPLSVKLNPDEIKFRINHSEAKMVLISSLQAHKLKAVIKEVTDSDGSQSTGPVTIPIIDDVPKAFADSGTTSAIVPSAARLVASIRNLRNSGLTRSDCERVRAIAHASLKATPAPQMFGLA